MGVEGEGVVGACCVSLNRRGVWGREGGNGDSCVREVFIVCVDVCCVIEEFANAIGGR